jgi:hypothetical protein
MNFLRRAKRALTAESTEAATPALPLRRPTKEQSSYHISNKMVSAAERLQHQCQTLHFSSGLQVLRYVSMRATPALNGRVTNIRVSDKWLAEVEPVRVIHSKDTTGTNVAIVGFQGHITTLSHASLMELLKVVTECCDGPFDLLIHKVNSDVKLLASIDTMSTEEQQEVLKVMKFLRAGDSSSRSASSSSTTSSSTTTSASASASTSTSTTTSFGPPVIASSPTSELLQSSLSFAHSILTLLPSNTIFMDIVGGINVDFDATGEAFLDYIQHGHPQNFAAIMSPHSLKSMRTVMSIIRYTLRTHMDMPLIPTPVLQAFGEYFEDNSSRSAAGETLPNSSRRRSSSFDGARSMSTTSRKSSIATKASKTGTTATTVGTATTTTKKSSSKRSTSVAHRPLKRPLSTNNPASMTLLMIPARDRNALLLVVSLFSRMLLTIEPKSYFFLMSLVGIFYEVVVDPFQRNNTPLFVAGLIREFKTLARAEASRASLMIRRTQGTTVFWSDEVMDDGNKKEQEEAKNTQQKLRQCIERWSHQELKAVLHYSNRLLDLVSASVEGTEAAENKIMQEIKVGEEDEHEHEEKNGEAKPERAIGDSGDSGDSGDVTFKKIVGAFNLVFQRASPVIPNYVWEMLQRLPAYFGRDTVTCNFVIQSIVRDMVTSPRIEILRQLYRLKKMLVLEGSSKKESRWVDTTMCDLIAPYDVQQHELILKVFDLCWDLKGREKGTVAKLSVACPFADLHDQLGKGCVF